MIHRTFLIWISLFIGIPLTVLIAYFGLNYSGFCFAKMRYLSDKERIEFAFNSLNNAEKLRINIAGKMQYHNFIKYESFDEYIKEYPDCCAVNPPGGADLPPPEDFERIFGRNSGKYARIHFKIRYLEENGLQKSNEIRADIPLENCGETVSYN